jgi:2,3-bisphosphoglycerate-dependent phosphoglycerate mutase
MHSSNAPAQLWVVRHGQSTGNVASERAESGELDEIEVADRDMDVELSDLGREQADAVGRWFARLPADEAPTVVRASPYRRARETAERALAQCDPPVRDLTIGLDERLRDRDLGALDRLTVRGITTRFPDQAALRQRVGKFYYRPPGGESWTDVLLRLRSFTTTLAEEQAGERVLLFTHDVVVMLVRYLLEGLDEATVLSIGRKDPVANGSVTGYRWTGERWELDGFNVVEPLREAGAPVTRDREERVDAT